MNLSPEASMDAKKSFFYLFYMGVGEVKRVGLLLGQSYQRFLMINDSTRGQQEQL